MITNVNEVDSWLLPIENSTPDFLTPHFISTNYLDRCNSTFKGKIGEIMEKKKYHFVYETTNLVNGKIYRGKHSTNSLEDGYLGSGKVILRAIKKYGKENFKRETLKFFATEEEAYDYEALVVNKDFVLREDTYNYKEGGCGGGIPGFAVVKNSFGETFSVSVDDFRFLSGELVGATQGNTGSVAGQTLITNGKINRYINLEKEIIPKEFWEGSSQKGLMTGITDGEENRRINLAIEEIPFGFWKGNSAVKGLTGITNGIDNKRINLKNIEIPEGFWKGNSSIKGNITAKDELGVVSKVSKEEFYNSSNLVGERKDIPSKQKGKTCITDGNKDRYINLKEEPVPEGWKKGSRQEFYWILESPIREVFSFKAKKEVILFCRKIKISYVFLEKNRGKKVEYIEFKGRRGKRRNLANTINWKLTVLKRELDNEKNYKEND